MIDNVPWNDPRSIPTDGRPVRAICHDHDSEYQLEFPVIWDDKSKCWRNGHCGTKIKATISGWRE